MLTSVYAQTGNQYVITTQPNSVTIRPDGTVVRVDENGTMTLTKRDGATVSCDCDKIRDQEARKRCQADCDRAKAAIGRVQERTVQLQREIQVRQEEMQREIQERARETQARTRENQERARENQERARETQERAREAQERARETQERTADRQREMQREVQARARENQERVHEIQERVRENQERARENQERARENQERAREAQIRRSRTEPCPNTDGSQNAPTHTTSPSVPRVAVGQGFSWSESPLAVATAPALIEKVIGMPLEATLPDENNEEVAVIAVAVSNDTHHTITIVGEADEERGFSWLSDDFTFDIENWDFEQMQPCPQTGDRKVLCDKVRVVSHFSNPNRVGKVKIEMVSSNIKVQGYEGREVIIEYQRQDNNPRTKGLMVNESDNVITIRPSVNNMVDAFTHIRVPQNTTIVTQIVRGNVEVHNVNGNLEINTNQGQVYLFNVGGSAIVHTTDGDIKAQFARLGSTVNFVTVNGDVDLKLPNNIRANVMLKSLMGDAHSDFYVQTTQRSQTTPVRYVQGVINGGGTPIKVTCLNGDISIKKR